MVSSRACHPGAALPVTAFEKPVPVKKHNLPEAAAYAISKYALILDRVPLDK
jgi:hypothetical protein